MADRVSREGLPVTPEGPRPGSFPIGSLESRAAARAMLEQRTDGSSGHAVAFVVSRIDRRLPIAESECIDILRASGHLCGAGFCVVRLSRVPENLTAQECRQFLRTKGCELVGSRNAA